MLVPVSHYSWFNICAFHSLLIVHLFCSLFDYFVLLSFSLIFVILFKRKKNNFDPEPCSGISILLPVQVPVDGYLLSRRSNLLYLFKYSTSSTYYHHRHSGIDETNIFQIDNHSRGRDRNIMTWLLLYDKKKEG